MTRTSNDSIPISSCVGKDVDPQFPYLPWNRLHIQNFIVREARSILALWSGNWRAYSAGLFSNTSYADSFSFPHHEISTLQIELMRYFHRLQQPWNFNAEYFMSVEWIRLNFVPTYELRSAIGLRLSYKFVDHPTLEMEAILLASTPRCVLWFAVPHFHICVCKLAKFLGQQPGRNGFSYQYIWLGTNGIKARVSLELGHETKWSDTCSYAEAWIGIGVTQMVRLAPKRVSSTKLRVRWNN